MASPHVAGAVSVMQRLHPNYSPAQLKNKIDTDSGKEKINMNCVKTGCSGSPNRMLHQKC